MEKIVVVGAKRTPIGKFGGGLKGYSAVALGIESATAAIAQSQVSPEEISLCIMGHVLQAGCGQAPARQVALGAKLHESSVAFSVNEVCGSGLKSIHLGMQALMMGEHEVVLVGGMESMSNVPYYDGAVRFGKKYGHVTLEDGIAKDGLTDVYAQEAMGMTAEHVASTYHVPREAQDAFAYESQMKASQALASGVFKDELVTGLPIDSDEFVRPSTTLEALSQLKPIFKKEGTVTAGNASGMNDGAAALVLTTESYAQKHQLEVLMTLGTYKEVGLDPSLMGYGPYHAIKALNMDLSTVDVFEINEAFASQSVAVVRDLGIDPKRVNPNGGAIALGHPLGASGARIVVSCLYEMRRNAYNLGVASLCIGGGMGAALTLIQPNSK